MSGSVTTLTARLLYASGSKRKHERGDSQDAKRLRASGHATRQQLKRAATSSGSNSKKTSNPRGRHAPEDIYDDRKNHTGRGSRADLPKGYSEKGLSRSRDSQRRIKPLLPELTEVREDGFCIEMDLKPIIHSYIKNKWQTEWGLNEQTP